MYVLKKYGYKIAILSGGFTYFGHYLQQKYGIDYVYANELEIENGKLTGRYPQHRQVIGSVTYCNGLCYIHFLNLRYQTQ